MNDTRANVDEVIVGNHHASVLVNRVTLAQYTLESAGKSSTQLTQTVLKRQFAGFLCCSARPVLASHESAIEETRHICSATFL